MECVFDFDPAHLILRVTITATMVADEAAIEIYRAMGRMASRVGASAGILDCSKVSDAGISARTVRKVAVSKPAIPEGRRRVVVAEQPAIYGVARMLELMRDSMGGQLIVVRSISEAYELLGARPEDFSQRLYLEDLAA